MKSIFQYMAYFIFQIFICIALFFHQVVFGQTFTARIYTAKDGLPESNILSTYTDKSGYLWITTTNGLSRYDGKKFVQFGLEKGLGSLIQRCIFEDSKHRLWVAASHAIGQLKADSFKIYPFNNENNVNYFFDIMERSNGDLLALSDNGVFLFEQNDWKKISLLHEKENRSVRNAAETDQTIYLNYGSSIGIRNPDKTTEIMADNAGNRPELYFNVLEKFNNRLFVSTFHSLYEIRNNRLYPLLEKYLSGKSLRVYFLDSRQGLWIFTREDGLVHFDLAKENPDPVIVPLTIKYYISHISEDKERNIWISTPEGLVKITIEPFSIYPIKTADSLQGIRHIFKLPGNQILLSNTYQGLQLFDGKKIMPVSGKISFIPGDLADAIVTDDQQNTWVATRYNKLYRLNQSNIKDFSHLLPDSNHYFCLDIDYNPNTRKIFICTDSTLLVGDSTGLNVFIPAKTGKPLAMPCGMIIMKSGEQLIYLGSNQLNLLGPDNQLIEAGLHLNIPPTVTQIKMLEDDSGNIWLATGGSGLFVLGKNTAGKWSLFEHFSTRNGLSNNNLHDISFDRFNQAWIVTSSGIDVIGLKENNKRIVVRQFNEDDGILCSNWNFGRLTNGFNGETWFSYPERLIRFDSLEMTDMQMGPSIVIEEALLNMKKTNWALHTDSFIGYRHLPYNPHIPYNQNNIHIIFQGIEFRNTRQLKYSYQLLPIDSNWSIPVSNNSVSFLRLPPGHYEFRVRVKGSFGAWSPSALFTFELEKPFWETWWFRVMALALTTSLMVGAYRLRIRRIEHEAILEKQLREMEMTALKAQMNPHFIYNALNSIQSLVADNKRNEAIHYIGTFSKLLRQTLDQSEKNVIPLSRELDALELYIQLESLRLNLELQYKCIIADDIVTEYEKIPPLTLQPFIENALWHGLSQKKGIKKLELKLDAEPGWLICQISDNGIGRSAAASNIKQLPYHESKGLSISIKRMQAFNQEPGKDFIQITDLFDQNQQPAGTRVSIRINRK